MRFRPVRPLSVAFLALAFVSAAHAQQEAAAKKTEFLKFEDDGHGGGKLKTAIATYQDANGVTVHLVGAVHIADQPYYDGLNRTFKTYDAVLYEMVKPRDAAPPQPGEERSGSMISVIQRFMKDTLDLKFQLDAVVSAVNAGRNSRSSKGSRALRFALMRIDPTISAGKTNWSSRD